MLFNLFLTASLRVAEKRFHADAATMGNTVQLQQKKDKLGKQDETLAGKVDGQEREGG